MSWKSLVSAGLLCILASPVLAVPTLNVNLVGLNAQGNWVWDVSVTPTAANTPIAVELGFRETSAKELLSASKNATNFDFDNPGADIFGTLNQNDWEAVSDTDGDGTIEFNGDDEPVGLQVNLATDEVFAALGSINFTTAGAKDMLDIIVQRPTNAAPNTTLQWLGDYGGNGRIAEDPGTGAVNTDTFAGTATKGVRGGNANLTAMVDVGDLAILGANYNQLTGTKRWQDADFTGDGNVDVGDLAVLGANYNQADSNWTTPGTVGGAGSGLGSGSGVPEPSTLALLLISGLSAACGMRRRVG